MAPAINWNTHLPTGPPSNTSVLATNTSEEHQESDVGPMEDAIVSSISTGWSSMGGAVVVLGSIVGVTALLILLVIALWATSRWSHNRKDCEERQQILLWPGAGDAPCTLQTREIRFTLPPSLEPVGGGGDDEDENSVGGSTQADILSLGDGSSLHSVQSLPAPTGGNSSGSSNTQEVESPSTVSLKSIGSGDTFGLPASLIACELREGRRNSCVDVIRRSSMPDMRRRSLQGYSLGALNPELYRIPDHLDDPSTYPIGHIGRVFFTIHYHHDTEKLQVGLLRVRNLPSRTSGSTTTCDPFIKLTVLPDERRYLQTKQKKKTCNPIFDEHFGFQIPLRNLCERTLRITVNDGGRSKKRAIIGHILYPLAPLLHPQEQPPHAAVMTRDLTREEDITEQQSDRGEVLLSLTFNDTLHRLTLTVFQAKGIQVNEGETVSWAKVSLMNGRRVVKSRKTVVVAASEQPQYNESFHFKPPQAMESVNFTVQMHMGSSPGSKGRLIGRVAIGSFMFARGHALNHWNQCLSAPKEPIQYWHSLAE